MYFRIYQHSSNNPLLSSTMICIHLSTYCQLTSFGNSRLSSQHQTVLSYFAYLSHFFCRKISNRITECSILSFQQSVCLRQLLIWTDQASEPEQYLALESSQINKCCKYKILRGSEWIFFFCKIFLFYAAF